MKHPAKKILAYLLIACLCSGFCAFGDSASAANPVELEKVAAVNGTELLMYYSGPVNLPESGTYLRFVDENYDLLWVKDGVVGAETAGALPIQYEAESVSYFNADKTILSWKLNTGSAPDGLAQLTDIYDALMGTGATQAYTDAGAIMMFGMENHSQTDIAGGAPISLAGATASAGNESRMFMPVNTVLSPKVTAAAISETKVRITFSEPVAISGNPFIALRVVDENDDLQWSGGARDSGTPLQWSGTWAFEDAEHKSIVWTIDGDAWRLSEILNFSDRISMGGKPLSDFAGCAAKLVFEETSGQARDDYVGDVVGSSGGVLAATNKAVPEWGDAAYVAVTPFDTSFRVVSAQAINSSQVRVTFSEPATISGAPFIALRYVDSDFNLQWYKPDGSYSSSEDGAEPLQWAGSWEWEDESHKSLLWTIDGWNINDVVTFADGVKRDGIPLSTFSDLLAVFCIEEVNPAGSGNIDPGLIENVVNTAGVKLYANKIAGDDKSYTEILPCEPRFYVKNVVASNAKQIVVEFSEPVREVTGSPYLAIRYVDADNNLQWYRPDGSYSSNETDGKPLQWDGTWALSKDHTKLVWTIAGEEWNVRDILEFSGDTKREGIPLSAYSGLKAVFCIEEDAHEKSGIDNMIGESGEYLFSNVVKGVVDRVYSPVAIDFGYAIPPTGDLGITAVVFAMAGAILCGTVCIKKKRCAAVR